MPASAAGWCSGARSASAPSARHDVVVDEHGLAEARAAVDDAVADGVQRGQSGERRPERFGVVRREVVLGLELVAGAEQAELEAARARVDDEDAHAQWDSVA